MSGRAEQEFLWQERRMLLEAVLRVRAMARAIGLAHRSSFAGRSSREAAPEQCSTMLLLVVEVCAW